MKSVAVILGSISAVHAGGDRKLAAPSGTHYAQSGMKDPVTGEDMTIVQWAAYDLDDGKGHGSTPEPHVAFGGYNCRGYYQSPIDVPKKAMQKEYRAMGTKKANTANYAGQYSVAEADSIYEHYTFAAPSTGWERDVDGDAATGKPKMYVGMIADDGGKTKDFGLKVQALKTADSKADPSSTSPVGYYRPLQFHWHFPSEHTVDGIGYPAELHIVHTMLSHFKVSKTEAWPTGAGVFTVGKFDETTPLTSDACSKVSLKDTMLTWSAAGVQTSGHAQEESNATACALFKDNHLPYLVLGFFLTATDDKIDDAADLPPVGATNPTGEVNALKKLDTLEGSYATGSLNEFVTKWGKSADNTKKFIGANDVNFDYKTTFGSAMKGRYYRYQGGLTTPPCTEGVEWVLFERPLKLDLAFFTAQLGTANTDIAASAENGLQHGDFTETGKAEIANLMKATPVWLRNNRPTIPIHGREVAYSQLTAMKNLAESTLAKEGYGGSNFNYLKPEVMWAKNNCWKDDPDNAGQRIQCNNQCGNAIADPIKARQAPINIVGAEVYKGVTPVNHGWLAANTFGYVDANLGTASRWVLKNTGHGFNVIPQFSFAGGAASHKDGQQSNTKPYTLTDFHASHRSLAGYAATVPHQYYVKKINAAANKVSWYPLQQFHFHFPSENTVDGYQYDGEMHMVHMGDGSFVEALKKNETNAGAPKQRIRQLKDAEGKDAVVIDISDMSARQLAAAPAATATATSDPKTKNAFGQTWADAVVFGFFLTAKEDADPHFNTDVDTPVVGPKGDPDTLMSVFGFDKDEGVPYTRGHYWTVEVANKKLGSVLFGPNVHGKQSLDATPQYDLSSPSTRNYFNYMGGLTTPGCNEGVQFIIFTDPLIIKKSEMRLFKQNYWANNRPTQPRGDRIVLFNDMANAQHPLKGMNKMTKVNPFAPVEKSSSTTIYAVSSSGGAATNALSMIVGAVMSTVTLALMM